MIIRTVELLCGAAMGLMALGALAQSSAYPVRPIKMVIPFAPGGASDFVGRIISNRLGELLGGQIVIENRAGAAGNIGMEAAAKAPADGYTLYLGNIGTLTINPALYANLGVNPLKDFAPVTLVTDMPSALVANVSLPVSSVKELVAYLKAQPGKFNYGSPGSGSLDRLVMEMFTKANGIEITHVPYKGGAGPAVVGLIGGETQLMSITMASSISFIKAGRLKGLAVTTANRMPLLPEVPTLVELGYPDLVASSWQGILVPAGTPREVVAKLHAALVQTMDTPDIKQKLSNGGAVANTSKSPEEFGEFLASETRRWGNVAREVGAKAD